MSLKVCFEGIKDGAFVIAVLQIVPALNLTLMILVRNLSGFVKFDTDDTC